MQNLNEDLKPRALQRVPEAIGGSLCISEVEIWKGGSQSWRVSLHLVILSLAELPPGNGINIQTSSRNPAEAIFQVMLLSAFANSDAVLSCVLKRIKIAFPHLKTKKQRLQLLHIHLRHTSMIENLMRLLRLKSNFAFDHRMVIGDPSNPQKPLLQAADSLVLASEDALFLASTRTSRLKKRFRARCP